MLIKTKKSGPDDVPTAEDARSLRRGISQMKKGQTRAWDPVKDDLEPPPFPRPLPDREHIIESRSAIKIDSAEYISEMRD